MSHPAASTDALAVIRASGDSVVCCCSSLEAPDWRSPATTRMTTNGRRNAATSS
jgi:hypothetical protein